MNMTMARGTLPSPTLQKIWYINSISSGYIWYIRRIYLSCPIWKATPALDPPHTHTPVFVISVNLHFQSAVPVSFKAWVLHNFPHYFLHLPYEHGQIVVTRVTCQAAFTHVQRFASDHLDVDCPGNSFVQIVINIRWIDSGLLSSSIPALNSSTVQLQDIPGLDQG